jgi:hypothetical protein
LWRNYGIVGDYDSGPFLPGEHSINMYGVIFQDRPSNRLCSIFGTCCASCHGRIRYVACLQQPESMKRILALGEVGSMWTDWISLVAVAIVAILLFGRGGG